MVYALVAAGGRGRRFGGSLAKQYADLGGVPLVVRTLRAFDACDAIDRLVLVVPAKDELWVRERLLPASGLQKPLTLVRGGETRQDSVFAGLCAIPEEDAWVAIHDAVRPIVSASCIAACVARARETGAAIAAVPLRDTLKKAEEGGRIGATVDREGLWLAQTPQVFRVGLIRAAHEEARRLGINATDDASLVERRGGTVWIVEGSPFNFKITTVEDLELAAALLPNEPFRAPEPRKGDNP
ncbi:MAG: 2-C-methyl-D-erythritol 4-phosphate cytidylyltransferase [Desulfobacterales bacterium]